MYLTTTLTSLPATTCSFSPLRPINLQGKPLPKIPKRKPSKNELGNLAPRLRSTSTSRPEFFQLQIQQQIQQQQQQIHHQQIQTQQSPQQSSNNLSPTIIQEMSLLEKVPLERASDFAAHMTCFLWFGDYIMDISSSNTTTTTTTTTNNNRRFIDYQPTDAFKKFCRDVISATQVSHSVILLSLLYTARMKLNYPTIKGQNGSEYRTFTCALMLANKFLDDNTYTNKTWSEVTNIPVTEINMMEKEFLSSLDYQLYVSEHQYFEWVRNMVTYVTGDDNNDDDDDNSIPDCTLTPPPPPPLQQSQSQSQYSRHEQRQYISAQHQHSIFQSQQLHQIQIQGQSQQHLVPALKRSVEEAFVDGMTVSPSKRSNCPYEESRQEIYSQGYYNSNNNHHHNNESSSSNLMQYEYPPTVAIPMTGIIYNTGGYHSSTGFPLNNMNMSFTTTVV